MRKLTGLFTEHPASVGEDYFTHMGMALSFAGGCLMASMACAIHAFLPFLCVKTGSLKITGLYDRMVTHRVKGHTGAVNETNWREAPTAMTPDFQI